MVRQWELTSYSVLSLDYSKFYFLSERGQSVCGQRERLFSYEFIFDVFADNVHFQHTAQLVEALTQSNVQFRMQVCTVAYTLSTRVVWIVSVSGPVFYSKLCVQVDCVVCVLQIYTDKAHSLSGGNTRRHLYELISDFLRASLY